MKIKEIRFMGQVRVPGTSDLKEALQSLFDGKPAWDITWDGGPVVTIKAVPGSIYARDSWSTLVPVASVKCMTVEPEAAVEPVAPKATKAPKGS